MVLPHIGHGELHLKIGRLCYGSMLLTCFGHGFALCLFTNKLDLAHIQWCCLVTGYTILIRTYAPPFCQLDLATSMGGAYN